jgi:phosphohistidine swiveling domain-containing protein
MSYGKISSKNYDFIFNVGGVNYLFHSIWLCPTYKKGDFLSWRNGDDWCFYIGKKERKKIGEKAYKLYLHGIKGYEDAVRKQLKTSKKVFGGKKVLRKLSNVELADDFERLIRFVNGIFDQYVWTEYLCLDKIEEEIENKGKDAEKLLKSVAKIGKLKLMQRHFINLSFYPPDGIFFNYYDEIRKRLNLGNKIFDYHYKELISALRGKRLPTHQDKAIFVIGRFSGWKPILGKNTEAIIKNLSKIDYGARELVGKAGNKGFYKGVVRKIDFHLNTDYAVEIRKMKKGEVLVSGSTGPEMMLACQKAGAIITDEGGITSHAAVISRELNIPCVVGTKFATKIFKTGDKVIVDANKGIVRKQTR